MIPGISYVPPARALTIALFLESQVLGPVVSALCKLIMVLIYCFFLNKSEIPVPIASKNP